MVFFLRHVTFNFTNQFFLYTLKYVFVWRRRVSNYTYRIIDFSKERRITFQQLFKNWKCSCFLERKCYQYYAPVNEQLYKQTFRKTHVELVWTQQYQKPLAYRLLATLSSLFCSRDIISWEDTASAPLEFQQRLLGKRESLDQEELWLRE